MSRRHPANNKIQQIISAKPIDFETAYTQMMHHHTALINNSNKIGIVWALEHYDIFTGGANTTDADVSETNVKIIHTDRGGKITYHGPGQIILYPIINIKRLGMDISQLITAMYAAVISTLRHIAAIHSYTIDKMPGIWVDTTSNQMSDLKRIDHFHICNIQNARKIASIGIKVKNGISYHGIALNANPNMKQFDCIMPCGLRKGIMTSIEEILILRGEMKLARHDITTIKAMLTKTLSQLIIMNIMRNKLTL